VAAAQFQLQRAVAALEQALQLLHALARHDDLALAAVAALQRGLAQGKAMAVGGNAAQRAIAQVEQQPIQVVADVLLGHGERGALDQFLQRRFRHRHALGGLDFVHRREIVGRQAGQAEAAAPGLHADLVAALADGDPAAVGQGPHDLEQLAGGNRDLAVLGVLNRGPRHHFHFKVGTGQRELAIAHPGQEVGQHRQGLPAFDHVDDLRQWLQQDFALQGEPHVDP